MEELIKLVKNELKITWSDPDTDKEMEMLVADAIPTMNYKLGVKEADADYLVPGQERRLFLNYCRYARNNCLEDFDMRYLNDILQLRSKYEVKYAKEQTI